MSRANSYSVTNMDKYTAIYPIDIANDIVKKCVSCHITLPSVNTLTDLLQNVFGCFYTSGFYLCIRECDKIDYLNRFYGSNCFKFNLKLRSSVENTSNAFQIGLMVEIDVTNLSRLSVSGRSVENWEMCGNKIRITKGRRSIFHTHGNSSYYGEWENISTDKLISGLAVYLKKHYKNRIIENSTNAKKFNNKMKLRDLELDDIRSLCDVLTNEDRNIFAHFYDDGKETGTNEFKIFLNNRNDFKDAPRDSYQFRDCTDETPACELASLKYFKAFHHINVYIVKDLNCKNDAGESTPWKITLDYPLTSCLSNVLNISPYDSKCYSELSDFADMLLEILEKDFQFCEKMNTIF